MSRVSNSHTVGIVASSSALADAAAPLAANAWGSVSTLGLTQSMITRGDSDHIISYCKNGQWSPNEGRIYFWGSTHGTQHLKRCIRYVVATDTWEVDHDNAPESDGANSHGYGHFVVRQSDNRQFHRHYGSSTVSTRVPGGAWSAVASLPGTFTLDWNVGNAQAWHTGLNSGAGGLVFAGERTCYTSNAAVSSWAQAYTAVGMNGSYHNMCVYNAQDGLVYFGGGNGSTNFYRVNANGTVTPRAALPFAVGHGTGDGGLFGGANGKVVAISGAGSIREFNDSTNSWSAQISTLPFTANEGLYFAVPMPLYEVIAFVWISGGFTPSTTMYIWKH